MWEWREATAARSSTSSSASAPRCDYEEERFTLDEGYVRAVLKVFVDLFDKGLIYRDYCMVNWDPGSRSAISDLEVEEREVTDTLYYVDYPLTSGNGSLTVATVRPETMLADTAIAVHPDDERYTRLVGETAVCRSWAAGCASSPTPTSSRSSAPARSRSPRATTRTTSRSAARTASRRSS